MIVWLEIWGSRWSRGGEGLNMLQRQKKCCATWSRRGSSPPRHHQLKRGQKQSPKEAELTQSRMEEEGWLLKIEAADSAKKILVEPIQWSKVGKLLSVPSTELVGVQENKNRGTNPPRTPGKPERACEARGNHGPIPAKPEFSRSGGGRKTEPNEVGKDVWLKDERAAMPRSPETETLPGRTEESWWCNVWVSTGFWVVTTLSWRLETADNSEPSEGMPATRTLWSNVAKSESSTDMTMVDDIDGWIVSIVRRGVELSPVNSIKSRLEVAES